MINFYDFYITTDTEATYNNIVSNPSVFIPDSLAQWNLIKNDLGYDPALVEKVDSVVSAFQWKFDDEHLDFAFLSHNNGSENDLEQYSRMLAIAKYDSIEISNNEGEQHTIKDLYVYFYFVLNQSHQQDENKKYVFLYDVLMARGKMNMLEVQNRYIFSHYLEGSGCCFGDTTLHDLVTKIGTGDYDENEIKLLLLSFDSYLSHESLEGIPYRHLEYVNKTISSSTVLSVRKIHVMHQGLNNSAITSFVRSMVNDTEFDWKQLSIHVGDFVEVFPNDYLYKCVFDHLLIHKDLVQYMMYAKDEPNTSYIMENANEVEALNFHKRFYFKGNYHKVEIDLPTGIENLEEEQRIFIRNIMAIREDALTTICNLFASVITYHMSVLE